MHNIFHIMDLFISLAEIHLIESVTFNWVWNTFLFLRTDAIYV